MPTATLNIVSRKLAYNDSNITSNPTNRYFDWGPNRVLQVTNPKSNPYDVAPGDSVTVFSGQRSTSIGSGTQFTLSLRPLSSTTYRFKWTGVGTNPAFRTDRALTLNALSVTLTANSNQTASLSTTAGSFTSVVVGDVLLIPGTTTGDTAGPFNTLNEGYWTVISKDGPSGILQLQRPASVGFLAYTQTVTITANTQVLAFSVAGVQVGDSVDISNGFSSTVQKTYVVASVTPTYFEVTDTSGLPISETAIPGVSGMLFYTNPRNYVYLECTQEAVVRLNGDTGNTNRISPLLAGDSEQSGWFEKFGPVWSLVIVNRSNTTMSVNVLTAE